MSSGKVLLGALAGLAAGALIGVLIAPEKGSDTRKKISKQGKENLDAMKDKFTDFLDNVSGKFDKVKEDVSNYTAKGKAKLDEFDKETKAAKV